VKVVRGGRIAGMLERRTRESQAIIQALELGYEIKGWVSSLEIFQQCDFKTFWAYYKSMIFLDLYISILH